MSSLRRNLFLSVFGAVMSASVAYAADLPAPPIIEYEPEVPVEIGSGWYLRGDLGVALYTGGHATWVNAANNKVHLYDEHLNKTWLAGVGAGYYFDDHWRSDITVDYRTRVKYKGSASCVPDGSDCTDPGPAHEQFKFSAWTLMLNGYYDFTKSHSITPYIGGGAGLALINTSGYTTNKGYVFGNKNQTNFAWNLMAGAAVDLGDNLKLDANYRFLSLGKIETSNPVQNANENPLKLEDVYAHEFRVGLRYDLN